MATATKTRFEIVTADVSGLGQEEIYRDNNSRSLLAGGQWGSFDVADGFIRGEGRVIVGYFGSSPVWSDDSGVHYTCVSYFDGIWQYSRAGDGRQKVITAKSGTGKLFAALENFHDSLIAAV